MPEPIIHDSTPKGSAILAYGESSRTNRLPIILALAAGMIAFACIALFASAFFGKTIPLPADTGALLYVRSGTELPTGIPDVWKRARSMSGPFPVLLGLRPDPESFGQRPFAIVPRFFGESDGTASWAFRLIEDGPSTTATLESPTSLAGKSRDYLAPAWLRIWPTRLMAPDDGYAPEDTSVAGPLTGGSWQTDARIPKGADNAGSIWGQGMIMLDAAPNAWPPVESMIRERGYDLRLTTIPSLVRWSTDPDGLLSVALQFDEPLTSTTQAEIAGSAGLADQREFPLPDGIVLTEFRLPFELSASSTEWTGDNGMKASVQDQTAFLGNPSTFSDQTKIPQHCTGSLIAVLDGKSINKLFEKLQLFSILGTPHQLIWLEQNGRATLCW